MKVLRAVCLALVAAIFDAKAQQLHECSAVDPVLYTIHLPHPSDCTMFLRCDHGIAKPERCPAQLHFNRFLQVCDWPQNAGCEPSGTFNSAGDSNTVEEEWNDGGEILEPQVEKLQQDQPLSPDAEASDEYVPPDWDEYYPADQSGGVQDDDNALNGDADKDGDDSNIFDIHPEDRK